MYFPGHAWRAKFRAYDNSHLKLAMETRLDSFADIAEKEGLPKTAAREQMYEMLKDGEASRLFLQYGDEERVWTILTERQRLADGSNRFRPDRAVAVQLSFTVLAIEYKTGPLERIFSRLNMIETRLP